MTCRDPLWPLFCIDSSSVNGVQGGVVSDVTNNVIERGSDPQREVVFEGQREVDQTLAYTQTMPSLQAECLELGHHHWLLPPEDENDRKRRLLGYCVFCGLEQWHGKQTGRGRRSVRTLSARQALARLPAASPAETLDASLAIDALSYANDGRWSSFSAIAAYVDDSPWFPFEFLKLLEGYGHIEVALDRNTMRPASWSMCPPTIATVREKHAVSLGSQRLEIARTINRGRGSAGGQGRS